MKKKKNKSDRSDRIIFTGIGITCLIGLFMLVWLYLDLTTCHFGADFGITMTSIVATNQHIATLVQQTDIAITEQFMLTGTALP